MKIAQISHFFDEHLGGIEIVAARLAREWCALGADVTWLAAGSKANAATTTPVRKVALSSWHGIERFAGVPYPAPKASAVAAIWRAVRWSDAVVVHDSLYLSNVIAAIFARIMGKPMLVIQHIGTVPYRSGLLRALMKAANRLLAEPLLRSASRVVFISSLPAEHFKHVKTRSAPLVVFNGVDTSTFRPPGGSDERERMRRSHGFAGARPVALFVGRFVEKKGLQVLARLAAMMPDVDWAFAGQGPLDPRRSGLSNVRVFEGLSGPTLVSLYQAADIFVLPSVGEGLPLVMQEALACGLPVVCGGDTATADPELLPLVTGVDVDASDVGGTAARFELAVRTVLASGTDPAQSAARARFARRRYDWTETAKQYLQILRSEVDGVVTPTGVSSEFSLHRKPT